MPGPKIDPKCAKKFITAHLAPQALGQLLAHVRRAFA